MLPITSEVKLLFLFVQFLFGLLALFKSSDAPFPQTDAFLLLILSLSWLVDRVLF